MAAFIYVSASDSDQVVIQRSAVSKSVNLSRLRVSVLRVAASVLNQCRNLLEHIRYQKCESGCTRLVEIDISVELQRACLCQAPSSSFGQ